MRYLDIAEADSVKTVGEAAMSGRRVAFTTTAPSDKIVDFVHSLIELYPALQVTETMPGPAGVGTTFIKVKRIK